MKIIEVDEYEEIDISVNEVMREDGRLKILPGVKDYLSIKYKPKSNKLTLVAGGHIGLIPINKDIAIDVQPKVPISNLTRIVAVAEDKFNTLDFFERDFAENIQFSSVVFEFMVECFAIELRTLVEEGLFKDYLFRSEKTNKIRGRLNIENSIKTVWSRGHFNKAMINFFDFTPDNPFNRLIKFTLNFCIAELVNLESTNEPLRDTLIEYYSMFDMVLLTKPPCSFELAFRALEEKKITPLRKYYSNICETCRLIINNIGVDFDKSGNEVSFHSFTIDMARTFEKYLINSLRNNRSQLPKAALVLDGNKEGRKLFFNNPRTSSIFAKPDIIIKEGNCVRLIADAKYKKQTKETDRYQIIAHALSYNSRIAVLVLPREKTQQGPSLVKTGEVGKEFQVDVYEYFFDLANSDLSHEEENFALALAKLTTDFTTKDITKS